MATATKARAAAPIPTLPRGTLARFEQLPIDSIDVADNVRTTVDETADAALAESIQALGILQPITVTETAGGRYVVRYGHRRLRAAAAAGLAVVDAFVEADPAPASRAVEQLAENLVRSDLSPLEEAHALRAILDADPDLTQAALAQRLGRSAPWVSNALRILELAKPVTRLLEDGKISGAHAKVLAGVAPERQAHVARAAVQQGLSAHDLEREAPRLVERAEWEERSRMENQARDHETAQKAIADLVKRGAQQGDPLVLSVGYQGADAYQALRIALTAAGYQVTTAQYVSPAPGTKYCSCRAWAVTPGYSKLVARHCVVSAHGSAQERDTLAREDAKHRVKLTAQEAAQRIVRTSLAAHPLDRPFAELLLWQLLEWSRDDWARARRKVTGTQKTDPWVEIQSLGDADLADEIARRIIPNEGPPALAEAAA